MCRDKTSTVNMESRKNLDLNEFPPDEQHERPFQEGMFAPTKNIAEVDLNDTFTGMDYAYVNPIKVKNEINQFAQTEWNSNYRHQTYQTLMYVQAILEAGPNDPRKATRFARTVQPKPNGLHDDIRRASSSKDPEPKLKSTTRITPKPENSEERSNTMPKELQMFYARHLQQQQLYSQLFLPKQLHTLPFQRQQLYAQLLQQQQRYAWLFQQDQLDARSFHQQQLDAQKFQQKKCALPFRQQQLYTQQFHLEQQHPSSSAVKAEPAGSSDHRFENNMPIRNIEQSPLIGTASIRCRPHCPYLHDMSARLENHDVFESPNKQNKSKKNKKRDQGDYSCIECQDSAMPVG